MNKAVMLTSLGIIILLIGLILTYKFTAKSDNQAPLAQAAATATPEPTQPAVTSAATSIDQDLQDASTSLDSVDTSLNQVNTDLNQAPDIQ